jgi:hypothetical protein
MRQKTNGLHVALAASLFAFLGACAPLEGSDTKASDAMNQWITKHVNKDEKLLCHREQNGEYFFLAKGAASGQVKAGARIEVTGTKMPMTTIVAWHFKNEKDDYVTVKAPPSRIVSRDMKDNEKMYSESVEYQTLKLSGSKTLNATIQIKKCPTSECERQQRKSPDEKEYTIKLCEIPLT